MRASCCSRTSTGSGPGLRAARIQEEKKVGWGTFCSTPLRASSTTVVLPAMSYNDVILAQPGPSSQTITPTEAAFVRQFRCSGGTLNAKCKLVHYEALGTGMVAAETIEEGELLFSIPRHMLLNLKNSILPEICRRTAAQGPSWEDVNTGWLGLMLTMMWESFRAHPQGSEAWSTFCGREKQEWHNTVGEEDVTPLTREAEADNDPEGAHASLGEEYRHGDRPRGRQGWGFYFGILPRHFDTPMFWDEKDLAQLKGTNVIGKIGKDDATKDYVEKIRPFILARPQIFFGSLADNGSALEEMMEKYYSLEHFHTMGSLLLSRSFHVKDATEGLLGEEGKENDEREMLSDGGLVEDSDSEDEEEDIEAVSMVPMADMLNARSGCDNAHLFYKVERLEMRATQEIKAGEQIWNTYGDPPSSDLLRRYGYVDLGNAADVVELSVHNLVAACLTLEEGGAEDSGKRRLALLDRIQWVCSLGLDEEVALGYPFPPSLEAPHRPMTQNPSSKELKEAASELPEELLILARLLCLSDDGYSKAREMDRLPKPRIDAVEEHAHGAKPTMAVAELVRQAIEERVKEYPTSMDEDEHALYSTNRRLSTNERNALVVRLSEKRILAETHKVVSAVMDYVESKKRQSREQDAGNTQNGSHKKPKRG